MPIIVSEFFFKKKSSILEFTSIYPQFCHRYFRGNFSALNKNVSTPHSLQPQLDSLQLSGLSKLNQVPVISRIWDLWVLKAAMQGSGQSSSYWIPTRRGLCTLRWTLHSAQLRPSWWQLLGFSRQNQKIHQWSNITQEENNTSAICARVNPVIQWWGNSLMNLQEVQAPASDYRTN